MCNGTIRHRLCECLILVIPLMVTILAVAASMDVPAAEPLPLYGLVESAGIDGMAPIAVQPRAPPVI